ncbi:hypothetical protein J5Y03_01340 [Bacillus sp. RG28]|uniref:Uncharacterized protein n=1 Tax=Gottfriedia endophytica TaxID=2820819 RepID=A0A940NKF8_9BACI|nr:hypothetical protein [Gottfriedia endophytica]MBP0723824.1 hypothetical protein [Gottfriedia endophytica]
MIQIFFLLLIAILLFSLVKKTLKFVLFIVLMLIILLGIKYYVVETIIGLKLMSINETLW